MGADLFERRYLREMKLREEFLRLLPRLTRPVPELRPACRVSKHIACLVDDTVDGKRDRQLLGNRLNDTTA